MIVSLTLFLAIAIDSLDAAMRNLHPRKTIRNPTIDRLTASTSTETTATPTFNAECAQQWLSTFEPCVISSSNAESIADCIANGVMAGQIMLCGNDQSGIQSIAPTDLISYTQDGVVIISGWWMQYLISGHNVDHCMMLPFRATPVIAVKPDSTQTIDSASIVWSTTEYLAEPCTQYDVQSTARSLLADTTSPAPTQYPTTATQGLRVHGWISSPGVRMDRAIEGFYSRMTSSYKSTLSVYDSFESVYGLRAAQNYFCQHIISVGNGCPAATVSNMIARMRSHHGKLENIYTFEYPTGISMEYDHFESTGVSDTTVTLTYTDEETGCVLTRVQKDTFVFNQDWLTMTCSTVPSWDKYTEECSIFDDFDGVFSHETRACP